VFNLIHKQGFRLHLLPEAGAMATSIIVAELFYKFHSFTLECLAFLVTWYTVSGVVAWARRVCFGSTADMGQELGG